MTIKEQVSVSQEARDAAEGGYLECYEEQPNDAWLRALLAGKHDDDPLAQAFARFERETLERAAKVAEGEKYGERVTQATYNEGNDTLSYYNEACDDIAQAIRSLTDRK